MAKSKGPIVLAGKKGDRGLPKGSLPKVSEKTKGPITFSGSGGNRGIPGKTPGKGSSSKFAATHD